MASSGLTPPPPCREGLDFPADLDLGIFESRRSRITAITQDALAPYDPSGKLFDTENQKEIQLVSSPNIFDASGATEAVLKLLNNGQIMRIVEIGGTNLRIASASMGQDGQMVITQDQELSLSSTGPESNGEGYFSQMKKVTANNVVVIVAGPVDEQGRATLTNLNQLGIDAGGQPVDMSRIFSGATIVTTVNDGAAGMTGEIMRANAEDKDKQPDTIIYAILGTGLGGSYANKLLGDEATPKGLWVTATTEVGHLKADDSTRITKNYHRPTRLSRGETPVESFVGGNALVEVYNALAEERSREIRVESGGEISRLATQGDDIAKDVLFNAGRAAAQHILGLIKLAEADHSQKTRIVVCGSVGTKAPDMLKLIQAFIFKSTNQMMDIVAAQDDTQMKGGVVALAIAAEQAERNHSTHDALLEP